MVADFSLVDQACGTIDQFTAWYASITSSYKCEINSYQISTILTLISNNLIRSLFLYLLCITYKSISNIASSYFSKVLKSFYTLIYHFGTLLALMHCDIHKL